MTYRLVCECQHAWTTNAEPNGNDCHGPLFFTTCPECGQYEGRRAHEVSDVSLGVGDVPSLAMGGKT